MTPPEWEEEDEGSAWIDEFVDDDDEELEAEEDQPVLGEDEEEEEFDDEAPEEEDEDELESLIEEGEALIEEGEYGQALEIFREASERFSDRPIALYHLGQTALMVLSDAIEEDGDHSSWQDDDELVGLYEEALNAFDVALSVDEEFYPALNGQGALYLVVDNRAAAVECWERSLEIEPDQEDISQVLEETKGTLSDEEE